MARGGSTVVDQLTVDIEFEGSNPATGGARREKNSTKIQNLENLQSCIKDASRLYFKVLVLHAEQ